MSTTEAIASAIAPVVGAINATIDSVTARTWYAITNKPDGEEAEVMIYDEIGAWGVSAKQFITDLRKINAKTINVRMNSPGGDVIDATAIYNGLRAHGARINVNIEGMALSAGSFIAMAGDNVRMAKNGYMMIHNAWGIAIGDSEDLRKHAELMDKMNDNIAGMYEARAGKERKYWRGLMDAETWFTGQEAKDAGLVDEAYDSAKSTSANHKAFSAYNKVPKELIEQKQAADAANQNNAPEASQRSESPPAVSTQEPKMATETTVTPAQTNNAASENISSLTVQAINGYIDQGKRLGVEEGKTLARNELQKLMEVAPGEYELIVNSFMSRLSPDSVSLTFRAVQQEKTTRMAELQQRDETIARLHAINAAGGHSGVPMSPKGETVETYSEMDPEVQAKMEWDTQPSERAKFGNNERAYTLYRVNQLKGNVRVLSRTA